MSRVCKVVGTTPVRGYVPFLVFTSNLPWATTTRSSGKYASSRERGILKKGMKMFGPSQDELLLLLHLPLLISLAVALFMLFSRSTFAALIAALFLSAVWVAIAIGSLGTIVGAFMLMASAWATLLFVSLAFYVSWRSASNE